MKYTYSESIAQNMKEIMESEEYTSLFSKKANKMCETCSQDADSCMCGDNNYAEDSTAEAPAAEDNLSLDNSTSEDKLAKATIDAAIFNLIKAADNLEALGLVKSANSALEIANLVVEAKKKMKPKKKKNDEKKMNKKEQSSSESKPASSKKEESSSTMPEFLKKKMKSASLTKDNFYSYAQANAALVNEITSLSKSIADQLEKVINSVSKLAWSSKYGPVLDQAKKYLAGLRKYQLSSQYFTPKIAEILKDILQEAGPFFTTTMQAVNKDPEANEGKKYYQEKMALSSLSNIFTNNMYLRLLDNLTAYSTPLPQAMQTDQKPSEPIKAIPTYKAEDLPKSQTSKSFEGFAKDLSSGINYYLRMIPRSSGK